MPKPPERQPIRVLNPKPNMLALPSPETPADPEPTSDKFVQTSVKLLPKHIERLKRLGRRLGPTQPLGRSAVIRYLIDHSEDK